MQRAYRWNVNCGTNLNEGLQLRITQRHCGQVEQGISNRRSFLKQQDNIIHFDILRFFVLRFVDLLFCSYDK